MSDGSVVVAGSGRWSVEEANNNPLQNDLGLVLKVILQVCFVMTPCQSLNIMCNFCLH